MNWDDLRIFLALARAGSVMKAARQLAVSHTTVSRRLKAFEAEVGVTLFARHPGKLVPTESGEALFAKAEQIEREVKAAERLLLQQDQEISGVVRLSAPPQILSRWLLHHFQAFSEAFPQIFLEVKGTADLLSLHRRETDIALRFTSNPPEGAVGRKLMDAKLGTYGHIEYLDAKLKGEEDDLSQLEWIGLHPEERDYDRHFLAEFLPHIRVKWRLSDSTLFYDAVLAKAGIARLPCIVAEQDPRLRRVPGLPLSDSLSFWMLTHHELRQVKRIRSFIDFMVPRILDDIERYEPV